jgi:hypothetical protein
MSRLFFSIILLCVTFVTANSQDNKYLKPKYSNDFILIKDYDSLQPYFISQKPVTNREYITYLVWLENVYKDYPEQLVYAFPSVNDQLLNMDQVITVKSIAAISDEFIRNYMLNPKYIDYPVLGVKCSQAVNYCKWLSDRYNEYTLIKNKNLVFDPNQLNENCFTTESFLLEQYEGTRNKDFGWDADKGSFIDFMWQKGIFLPAFRLPSKCELDKAAKDNFLKNKLQAYKSFEFIKQWETFEIVNNQYVFASDLESSDGKLAIKKYSEVPIPSYGEYTLDAAFREKNGDIIKIYKELNYTMIDKTLMAECMKDSLGKMPFIIIGENDSNHPVFLKQVGKKPINNSLEGMNIFRVAFCAISNKSIK